MKQDPEILVVAALGPVYTNGEKRVLTTDDSLYYTKSGTWVKIGGSAASDDGWLAGESWSFSSVDGPTGVFQVTGVDVTAKYTTGTRIKLTQTTVKYFIVTKVALSGSDTLVTMYGGTDYALVNAAISANFFSRQKAPAGMNIDPLKWTEQTTDSSERLQNTPTNGTWYNIGSVKLTIPIGAWSVEYFALGDVGSTVANVNAIMDVSLSTSASSESDTHFSCRIFSNVGIASSIPRLSVIASKRKNLLLASKTDYFLIDRTTVTTTAFIDIRGDLTPSLIRAVCAYL